MSSYITGSFVGSALPPGKPAPSWLYDHIFKALEYEHLVPYRTDPNGLEIYTDLVEEKFYHLNRRSKEWFILEEVEPRLGRWVKTKNIKYCHFLKFRFFKKGAFAVVGHRINPSKLPEPMVRRRLLDAQLSSIQYYMSN